MTGLAGNNPLYLLPMTSPCLVKKWYTAQTRSGSEPFIQGITLMSTQPHQSNLVAATSCDTTNWQPIYESYLKEKLESNWLDSNEEYKDIRKPNTDSLKGKIRRPDYNGAHLVLPWGGIYTVMDGSARAWISSELFLKIHYYKRCVTTGHNPRVTTCYYLKRTEVMDLAFIDESAAWNDDVGLVRNSAGFVAVIETPRYEPGKKVLYAVPSDKVMNHYNFNWDNVKQISDDVFNSYEIRWVCVMPDGSI